MNFIIKKQISNHPNMSWDGSAVERWVTFERFSRYDLTIKAIELELLLTLESPTGIILTRVPIVYKLHDNLWMDATGAFTSEELGVLTEVDFWLNLMVNTPITDKSLIETGIQNLDTDSHFFDTFI